MDSGKVVSRRRSLLRAPELVDYEPRRGRFMCPAAVNERENVTTMRSHRYLVCVMPMTPSRVTRLDAMFMQKAAIQPDNFSIASKAPVLQMQSTIDGGIFRPGNGQEIQIWRPCSDCDRLAACNLQ